MSSAAAAPESRAWGSPASYRWVLACLVLLFASALYVRNARFTAPLILGDEYYYATQSEPGFTEADLERTAQVELPRTLILELWRRAPRLELDRYFTAKTTNALLYAAILLPLVAIGRTLGLGRGAAIGWASFGLLFPFHAYSATFMPEPAYALTFWVAAAALASARRDGTSGREVAAGAAAAVHYLVKPHGVLLAVAMVAAVLAAGPRRDAERGDRRLAWLRAARIGGTFVAGVLLGGWIVTGAPISLGLYDRIVERLAGTQAAPTPFAWRSFLGVLGDHWTLLLGAFALAVPLLAWRGFAGAEQTDVQRFFFRFATLYLALQTVAVSWYTLTSSEAGRVHSRYYDFVLPVLALAVAVPLRSLPAWPLRLAQTGAAALGLALFWFVMAPSDDAKIRNAFIGDSPELVLVRADPGLALAVGGSALAAAIAWAVGWRRSPRSAGAALAIAVIVSFTLLQKHRVRETRRAQAFRAAGNWIQTVVPREELDAGAIVTPYPGHGHATLFFVPGAPTLLRRPRGSRVALEVLARKYDWVYVQPGHEYRIEGRKRRTKLSDSRGTLVDLTDRNLFGIRSVALPSHAEP